MNVAENNRPTGVLVPLPATGMSDLAIRQSELSKHLQKVRAEKLAKDENSNS